MRKYLFTLYSLLLLPVLFSGLPAALSAQDSGAAGNAGNSESALNRLIEISNQLSTLNTRLNSELQDSRRNSWELQNSLETSRLELEELRRELETLQSNSAELLLKAENSQTELDGLRTALRRAESSLMSLEISLAAYRESSERRISVLSREKTLWKWGCIGAGVLAAGFCTAYMAGR